MGLVNHLKEQDVQSMFLAVAYGKHVVTGHLAKSIVSGSSGTHIIQLQQMLGRGEWDGCEGLWFRGLNIDSSKYKLHPGKQTPNPTLKTFTANSGTDVITSTAHGLNNGDIVIMRPGDLPAPLIAGTLYYVRDKTTDTFKLAATSGGAAIDLTTNGTGTLQLWRNDDDQGVDTVFNTDHPHSGVAWIRAELASGVGDFDTKNSPPEGLKGIFRTMKVYDYDSSGTPGTYAYSTNAALQVADLMIRIGGRPVSRIDWAAWVDWRDFMLATIPFDYTALPEFDGFGLTAKYYNGTAFDTLITERVDPFVEFVSSAGSPAIGVNADNFSATYEGKIKAKYTETYTFYITHTHGARLYVDGLVTPLIDQWATTGTHSATIALTAGQFYDIKVEWKHTTGNADIKLEWQSTSQVRQVVPHRVLYPKTVDRPRYETHPFFSQPTRLDDAVRTILNLCNSTVQEVNGKLRFLCLEQLTETSFHFTNAKIIDGSVALVPRDPTTLRNSWQVRFRNVDSQYVEEDTDPVVIERPELMAAAGRKIDGDSIELFNCTRHQAYRTLNYLVKRNVDRKWELNLTGNADTLSVLPGDGVAVDVEFLNWTAKQALVVASNDSSSEETADERSFVLHEWTGDVLSVPLYDSDVTAFLAAAGVSDPTIGAALDTLVATLKSDGIWTKLDAIYPFVGGTAAAHKFNLKNPADTDAAFRITWNGTITHDADGITGDGSTGYGNTHFDPSVEIPSNEGSLGVYVQANGLLNGGEIGSIVSGSVDFQIATNPNGSAYFGANGAQSSVTAGAAGFHQVSRVDASNQLYKIAAGTANNYSSAFSAPAYSVYISALNNNGSPSDYSSRTISFAYLGHSLSSSELTDLYDAVQAFQTALGRDV